MQQAYEQQTAFTTAFVVAYARPFTKSHGWPAFPPGLMNFDQAEHALHKTVIAMRHQVFAHSDSPFYSVRPWRRKDVATDIVSAPVFRITADQGVALRQMIQKLHEAISIRLKGISAGIAAPFFKTLLLRFQLGEESRYQLQTEVVVYCDLDILLGAQIAFRRLDRRVPEKELDLLETAATLPAQLGAGATKIVGTKTLDADLLR